MLKHLSRTVPAVVWMESQVVSLCGVCVATMEIFLLIATLETLSKVQ